MGNLTDYSIAEHRKPGCSAVCNRAAQAQLTLKRWDLSACVAYSSSNACSTVSCSASSLRRTLHITAQLADLRLSPCVGVSGESGKQGSRVAGIYAHPSMSGAVELSCGHVRGAALGGTTAHLETVREVGPRLNTSE